MTPPPPSLYFLLSTGESAPLAADEAAWLPALAQHLDAEERARCERFIFPAKRLEFLLGRVLMKSVLAALHGVPDPRIDCPDAGAGKPRLAGRSGGPYFNLSHSHGALALIVAADREVAVDVEQVRDYGDNLAASVLSPTERAALRTTEDFFRFWTAKEAYMKLLGTGLSLGPRKLEVDLARREVLDTRDGRRQPFAWEARQGYVLTWMACEPAGPAL